MIPRPRSASVRDTAPDGVTWSTPIRAWPPTERPRERLLNQGAAALSDAELIAVLLGNGTPGTDAVATGRALLAQAGSVGRLLAGVADLPRVAGVGPVKRARLVAALELARRSLGEGMVELPTLTSPDACFDFLKAHLGHLKHEVIGCIFLDARRRVLRFDVLSEGTLNEASLYPRELVRACLRHHASAVILVHNHPSGDTTPSEADRDMTQTMQQALSLIEVEIIDHLVIGAGPPNSLKALGML